MEKHEQRAIDYQIDLLNRVMSCLQDARDDKEKWIIPVRLVILLTEWESWSKE